MLLKNIGTSALSDDDLNSLTRTRTNMSGIYNSARICPYNNQQCTLETQGLTLDPDIEDRLASLAATGGSYQEMQYLWVSFIFFATLIGITSSVFLHFVSSSGRVA